LTKAAKVSDSSCNVRRAEAIISVFFVATVAKMRQTDGITSDDQNGLAKAPYFKQKRFVIAFNFHYIRVPFLGRQRVF
jgi:hypothetical protein